MATVQPVKGKRGITYRVQFMRDGRRVSKTFKLKKDAQKFAASIIVDDDYAHSLSNYTLNTLTMAEAISQYKAQLVTADQSALHRLAFWADTFNGQAIGKVTKLLVKAELKKLLAIGRAPATVNRYKAALSAVFTWLADAHDIEHNPAKGIRQETENNARTRFLSGAELPRLMKAAKDSEWDRLYLLILMAVTTGARRTEMLSLKWSDIDLKTRTAHLSKTKNGEQRVLTLTQDLVDELMRFREVGQGYAFPHPSKLTGYFQNFDCYWYEALKQARITDFRFHDLRHTCASLLAMNGASLLEIAQVLGHKSVTMTQRYSHLCTKHKASLTDRVFGGIANDG